jgi:hypothetical protein
MATLGLSESQIALLLSISVRTLRRFFSAELRLGSAASVHPNNNKASSSPKRHQPPSDDGPPPFIPLARDVLIIRGPNGERLA